MKTPPNLHSVGDYWIWYGYDYTAYGRVWNSWFASPKASGAQRRGAVRISGPKGRTGATAKRVGTRQWQVTIPRHDGWSGVRPWKMHEVIVARNRREAILLAEIMLEYCRSNSCSPRLTEVAGKIYSIVKVWGETHRDPNHWEIVEPIGRRIRCPKRRVK